MSLINTVPPTLKKKRGRKPKGGKIINKELTIPLNNEYKPSIIMHLKCASSKMDDYHFETIFNYNTEIPIEQNDSYTTTQFSTYDKETTSLYFNDIKNTSIDYNPNRIHNLSIEDYKKIIYNINTKFINLDVDIHSDCFWCTCPFETSSIHIPKNKINHDYNAYGNFCSIECAGAYLFNENINNSDKFERLMYLNYIYNDIVKDTGVKPAPSPYYLLSKFCGNMTIDEFRNIYTTNHNIVCINKPSSLNIEFPELYTQISDDMTLNHYDAKPDKGFKIKRSTKPKKTTMDNYFNV